MKYIIIDVNGVEIPILFNETIYHYQIAKAFNYKVISAGHVNINATSLNVFGKSHSLNIYSRPNDALIIFSNLSNIN